jgi:5-methylcytosine-specific restriction endonuclease McrA
MRQRITKCENCGRKDNLQVHHLFSRKFLPLRYDPRNILVLCPACHFHYHQNPLLWSEKLKKKLGEEEYNKLLNDAQKVKKISNEELENLLEFLKKEVL